MNTKEKSDEKKFSIKKIKIRSLWKPIILVVIVIALFIIANLYGFGEGLGSLQDWIQSFGIWTPFLFVIIYIFAIIAAIPGTIFGFAAGVLFGSLLGIILVSIASTIGSSITFLIARYFARDAISRWVSTTGKFRRLDDLIERHGAIIVAITRLIPIFPFNLLNYGFGLTRVSFKTYVFWSWLCMLPGSIVIVVGADVITKGLSEGKIPWELIAVVIIFIVVVAVLTWYAYRSLQKKDKIKEEAKTPIKSDDKHEK